MPKHAENGEYYLHTIQCGGGRQTNLGREREGEEEDCKCGSTLLAKWENDSTSRVPGHNSYVIAGITCQMCMKSNAAANVGKALVYGKGESCCKRRHCRNGQACKGQ